VIPSEKEVQDKLLKKLRDLPDSWWFKVAQHAGTSRRGVPDVIGCYKGRFHGIELKKEGKRPTALQAHELALISAAGGISIVCEGMPGIERTLGLIAEEKGDPACLESRKH
jgi:hypothetical protein